MKSSTLALTTTATRKKAARTDAQALANQAFQAYAAAWNAMSDSDRCTWFIAAQLLHAAQTALTQPAMTAFNCYVRCASDATGAGYPLPTTCPAQPDPPPALPNLTLSATDNGGTLSLTLTSDTAYPHRAILTAAAPVYGPQSALARMEFKRIEAIVSIPAATLDISSAYLLKYRTCGVGMKIAVTLFGVSANGFRSAPVSLTAVVEAPALSLSGDGS